MFSITTSHFLEFMPKRRGTYVCSEPCTQMLRAVLVAGVKRRRKAACPSAGSCRMQGFSLTGRDSLRMAPGVAMAAEHAIWGHAEVKVKSLSRV